MLPDPQLPWMRRDLEDEREKIHQTSGSASNHDEIVIVGGCSVVNVFLRFKTHCNRESIKY